MKNSILKRCLHTLKQINLFKSIHVDYYQYVGLMFLICGLLLSMFIMALRPLNIQQHQDLLQLSAQTHYPLTRKMAWTLLQQSSINRYQYFRVLRAAHLEQHHIHVQEEVRTETKKSSKIVY